MTMCLKPILQMNESEYYMLGMGVKIAMPSGL